MTIERRIASELRARGRKLEGLAAPFGQRTRIGSFHERVAPGAFRDTLADGHDIVALVDHDATRVLGRTKAATLKLSESTRGLEFAIDLPKTSYADDILALVESGNAGGASFGFRVRKDGEHWEGDVRELRAVDLIEISVVSAFPAYDATEVHARARAQALAKHPRLAAARRWLDTL